MVSTRSGVSTERNLGDTADTHVGKGRSGDHRAGASPGLSASASYTLLGAMHAMLAGACALAPKLVAKAMFGRAADPFEDQHGQTLGLLSCGLLSASAISFALEETARKHMLRTFTADALKAALMAFAASNVVLQLYYPATLTPLAAIAQAGAMAATTALPAGQLLGREDFGRVSRDFRRLPHNLQFLLTLKKFSLVGALYLLLTWIFPLAGLMYFAAPKYTLYHTLGYIYGKSTQYLWKAVGGGLMTLLPATTWTLKDKTENDLLGRSISRTLNIGLMLASIGHLMVFGPVLAQRHGGFLLPLLTSTWSLALLASMLGLSAPEARDLLAAAAAAEVTGGPAVGPAGSTKGKEVESPSVESMGAAHVAEE